MTLDTQDRTNSDDQPTPADPLSGSSGDSYVFPAPDTPDKPTSPSSPFSCPASDAVVNGVKKAVVLLCTGSEIESSTSTTVAASLTTAVFTKHHQERGLVEKRQLHEVHSLTAVRTHSGLTTYGSTAINHRETPSSNRYERRVLTHRIGIKEGESLVFAWVVGLLYEIILANGFVS